RTCERVHCARNRAISSSPCDMPCGAWGSPLPRRHHEVDVGAAAKAGVADRQSPFADAFTPDYRPLSDTGRNRAMNRYALAADAVMLAHFLFIAFALFGSLLLLKWPRLIWLHIPALCWGIYIELSGNICPLTPLENHFRELAGESSYYGG